ncbi:MAG: alpha-D-glucose phosphate-specific phosphoglucomutase, partial [Telluria sp.]
VDAQDAEGMMAHLRGQLGQLAGQQLDGFTVALADDFVYTDPVDLSVTSKQGVRIVMTDGSRIVFRLSGTGTEGATIRLYLEKYEADQARHAIDPQQALAGLAAIAANLSQLKQRTGRDHPTVVT